MITVGQIGCGYWGPNLLRNFVQLKDASIRAVAEINDERIEYLRLRYPQVRTTQRYQDILHDPRIDAVVVATSARTHYDFAKEILESDKHVLVEKPLAMTTKEALDLISLAEQKNKVLMVGHTFEYNAAVNALKRYVQNGEIGNIYYIYSQRLNLGIVRSDINAMWNLAPHDISILIYLLGVEPVSVSAWGVSYLQERMEDVVFIVLLFPNNITAHIHVSWLDPSKVRKMTVVGDNKMIIYDDISDAKIQIYDKGIIKKNNPKSLGDYDTFGKFQLIRRAGDIIIPKIDFVEPLQVECSHFIECIKENKKPLTDGYDGLRVVKVLEAAQKSIKNKGIEVRL